MRNRRALTVVLVFVAPLLLVDVAQAYYTPGLGRFINRDPLFELGAEQTRFYQTEVGFGASLGDEFNLYWYVKNDPVDLIDPFGEKARVSVDPKNCTLTVTLNIGIYGPGATSALASKIESCINSHWNGHTTKKGCSKCDPGNCKVAVEAHVKYYANAKHWPDVPEDNQIKIRGSTGKRSWVFGPGGSWGHWEDDTVTLDNPTPCWTFAHEAGHLMGLGDDYSYWTGKPHKGHEDHMMGRYGKPVAQHEIDGILDGKKCPKECCCPPTSKPTTR